MVEHRRLIGNSLSLLVNRLTQSLTAFILVAFIARMLGSYELGQYTLAFTYYFVFMTIASAGFKALFTRELSRDSSETSLYLSNGTLLQLLFSIAGYLLLVIVVFALPYSTDTSVVCYIMGLTIIPFSLSNVTEAIFQAQEKMYLIAVSTVPVYVLRLLVILWGMQLGYGVSFIATIFAISETLILLLEWGLITQWVRPHRQISWSFMQRTTKAVLIFIGIDGIAILKERMQILILSLLSGEIAVGLYGAVMQLMQPFQLISYSLVIAAFPSLSKAVYLEREKQRRIVANVIEILLSIALPLMIGLLFVGRDLLVLIYQDPGFTEAFVALIIVSLGLVTSSFIQPLGYTLVANGFEKINLFEVTISTVVGSLVSIMLIYQYHLNGAAIAALLIQVGACSLYIYCTYARLFSLQLWEILRRPILIGFCMLAIFLVLQQTNHNLLLTLIVATSTYVFLISILAIYAFGGPGIVWTKLLREIQGS